jgi:hypothetical protein
MIDQNDDLEIRAEPIHQGGGSSILLDGHVHRPDRSHICGTDWMVVISVAICSCRKSNISAEQHTP